MCCIWGGRGIYMDECNVSPDTKMRFEEKPGG